MYKNVEPSELLPLVSNSNRISAQICIFHILPASQPHHRKNQPSRSNGICCINAKPFDPYAIPFYRTFGRRPLPGVTFNLIESDNPFILRYFLPPNIRICSTRTHAHTQSYTYFSKLSNYKPFFPKMLKTVATHKNRKM